MPVIDRRGKPLPPDHPLRGVCIILGRSQLKEYALRSIKREREAAGLPVSREDLERALEQEAERSAAEARAGDGGGNGG